MPDIEALFWLMKKFIVHVISHDLYLFYVKLLMAFLAFAHMRLLTLCLHA